MNFKSLNLEIPTPMAKEITKKKETLEPNDNQKALPFGKAFIYKGSRL